MRSIVVAAVVALSLATAPAVGAQDSRRNVSSVACRKATPLIDGQ
jgi:hypothetical protein